MSATCPRCAQPVKSPMYRNTVDFNYYMRVLDDALPDWLAIGWKEVGRTRIQSLDADDVLIEYNCAGDPPMPAKRDR